MDIDRGIDAVLTQTIQGIDYVISYVSRSLTVAKQEYNTAEKELLTAI